MLQQYTTLQYSKSRLMIYTSFSGYDQKFYNNSSQSLNNNNSLKTLVLRHYAMLSHFVTCGSCTCYMYRSMQSVCNQGSVKYTFMTNIIISMGRKETTVKTIINSKDKYIIICLTNSFEGHQRHRSNNLLKFNRNGNATELVRTDGLCCQNSNDIISIFAFQKA